MNPPPTFPVASAAKNKIPSWVWVLTVLGAVLIVGVYSAMFWGFNKLTEVTQTEIKRANPDFEMVSFSTGGKMKVRHKHTGKDFFVPVPRAGGLIRIRDLTTKALNPAPAWIQLKDAVPAQKGGWDRMGDNGSLLAGFDDLFADHEFVIEAQDKSTITACNSKLLQCVVISYHIADTTDNRSWYSAVFLVAP